jgi:hypothetical protein
MNIIIIRLTHKQSWPRDGTTCKKFVKRHSRHANAYSPTSQETLAHRAALLGIAG